MRFFSFFLHFFFLFVCICFRFFSLELSRRLTFRRARTFVTQPFAGRNTYYPPLETRSGVASVPIPFCVAHALCRDFPISHKRVRRARGNDLNRDTGEPATPEGKEKNGRGEIIYRAGSVCVCVLPSHARIIVGDKLIKSNPLS